MMTYRLAALTILLVVLGAACTNPAQQSGSQRIRNAESLDRQSFLTMDRPPIIAARDAASVEVARRLVSRLTPDDLRRRKGARIVDARSLPWLSGSPEGRAFLTAEGRRVLVRGRPAEVCPIAEAYGSDAEGAVADLVGSALTSCLEMAGEGCGCEVIAVGSILLVPRETLAYATGISARIRARALGLDGFLVAEDQPDGTMLLRDLSGPVGVVRRTGTDKVVLRIKGSPSVFRGTVRDVGYRRGRLAQRIYAEDEDGDRISLLVGFDPGELAQFAGAWLAWPPDT